MCINFGGYLLNLFMTVPETCKERESVVFYITHSLKCLFSRLHYSDVRHRRPLSSTDPDRKPYVNGSR